MYVSMTGYGEASAEREWGTIRMEISSVNHRYQEISVRLPRELSSFEPWLHQRLRGLYKRGKVQVRAEITRTASSADSAINGEALAAYYREISSIRDLTGIESDISLDALINLPGVLDMSGYSRFSGDQAIDLMSELLERASENWNEMRRAEGSHLKENIDGHMADIERDMAEIGRLWTGVRDAAFAGAAARISKTLESAGFSLTEARFAQEAVIMADKWDIAEELERMASHVLKFREIGESGVSEGRKMDFLVQEMNREANTINSKILDSGIRWITVEVKSSIERMREQIQNLE
jgi:uncharacterized protein (TIGR00255 family)